MISNVVADFGESADRLLGVGLGNRDADRLLEHSTSDDGMYSIALDQVGDGLVFTLPNEDKLESIVIWNYNKPGCTNQGIGKMDVSVWTEQNGWKAILTDVKLQEGEGSNDYDEPTVLIFKPVLASKVRFGKLTPFDPKSKQIGLSEVRFHEPLGAAAYNFKPQDGSQAAYSEAMPLSWTAGRNAVVHDVYVGESEETLEFLGRIKGLPEATVSGLSVDKQYVWRIDEVTEDGVIETGKVLSFTTRGSLVGYWPLDETADDAAGSRNGTIIGQPKWVDGHTGKALKFDGKNDYVEIPALNLNTDSLTICAWVQADKQNDHIPGIVFCRTDKTIAGINLIGDRLRYHWNDLNRTYNWDSGFAMPIDKSWVFVALTVGPDKGVLYFCKDGGKLEHSENRIPHQMEEFDGPVSIGRDAIEGRLFKGMIDEVHIFDFPLSESQIEQVRKGQELDFSSKGKIQLVGANLIEKDQSLAEAAGEQQAEAAGEQQEDAVEEKGSNLLPVAVIIAIIIAIAVLSKLKKKK